MSAALTGPQARLLAEIRSAGAAGRVYNGRARRSLTVLQDAGLITVDFTVDLHSNGTASERWECWSVEGHDVSVEYGTQFYVRCSCGQFEFLSSHRYDATAATVRHLFNL